MINMTSNSRKNVILFTLTLFIFSLSNFKPSLLEEISKNPAITPTPQQTSDYPFVAYDPIPGTGQPIFVQNTSVSTQGYIHRDNIAVGPNQTRYIKLDNLALIYTNTAMGSISIEDVARLEQQVSDTTTFIWKHSHFKFLLSTTFIIINDYKDISEFTESSPSVYWLYPDDSDADGISVINDLLARGVVKDQYDIINYFWAHNGTYGTSYGGLGGGHFSALGLTGITENPIAWWFYPDGITAYEHEIHHAIDALYDLSGYPGYFFIDRPWDLSEKFGEGLDYLKVAVERMPQDDWFTLINPWGTVVLVDDYDHDGIPDNPIPGVLTEASLGTDPLQKDTDQDRLSDMDELLAGIVYGSSPLSPDTDGDGKYDGDDYFPKYHVSPQIIHQSHILNGENFNWDVFSDRLFSQNTPLSMTVSLNWDESYFYVMVTMDRFANVQIQIDAQNDGWFHGKDNYSLGLNPSAANADLVTYAHIWDSSVATISQMKYPYWDDDPNYPFGRLITADEILRFAQPHGNGYLVQLAIPRNDVTGLQPEAGKGIGLQFSFSWIDHQPNTYARLLEKDAWIRPFYVGAEDVTPPISSVTPLPPVTKSYTVLVQWSGSDDSSGVHYYDVQYRDGADNGWIDFTRHVTDTSKTFTGVSGHTYYFRSRAWDNAGNAGIYSAQGDAWTEIRQFSVKLPLTINKPYRVAVLNDLIADEEILQLNCNQDWITCRNKPSGNAMWHNLNVGTIGATYTSQGYTVERTYLFFDTTVLPVDAQVLQAYLRIYIGQYINGNSIVHIIPSVANIPLTPADFGNIYFLSLGTGNVLGNNQWFEIGLNESAFSWITKGGITKFALIQELDLQNIAPTTTNSVIISLAEDVIHAPQLVVNYLLP